MELTREQIEKMGAGRELDAEMARLMGYEITGTYGNGALRVITGEQVGGFDTSDRSRRWSPSTDIAAAWEVHKEMCGRIFSKRIAYLDALGVLLTHPKTGDIYTVAWPSALRYLTPLLIVKAALIATLEEK